MQYATLAGGGSALSVVATGVSLSLGGGVVTLTGGQGALLVSSSAVAGQLSGTIAVSLGSSVQVSGSFSLAVNDGTAAIDQSFTVGSSSVSLNLPGGPYVQFQATGATIDVLGQTLSGNVAIEQDSSGTNGPVVRFGVTGGAVALGGSTPVLSITALSGGAVRGTGGCGRIFSGTVAVDVPNVSLSGSLSLQVNTSSSAVSDTITVGGVPVPLSVPAGPFVQVAGTGVALNVLGQTVSGDVTITSQSGTVQIQLANLTAAFGGTAAAPVLSATQVGTGGFVISSAGIAGSITVSLALARVPGLALSGTFGLAIKTTSAGGAGAAGWGPGTLRSK